MPAIALGRAAYKRLDLPEYRLINAFYERTPANAEDQVSIIPRAGISAFLTQGSLPVRGLFCQPGTFSGDYVIVLGTTAYRVTVGGTPTSLGTIAGTARVVMAGNGSTVLISTGTTLYSTDGTTVSTVAFPDSANVVYVTFINGYFLAVRGASQRVYFSAINAATFDPLDFFAAENSPDNLVAAVVVGDELWLLGQASIEVHVPTGDADAPFLRINGRLFGIGCANADSVTKVGDSICFVGADSMVYRTMPNPTRISDHALETKLRSATAASLKGWTYRLEGHEFFVLNIGSETFAFDTAPDTGFWHEMRSYNRDGFRGHCSQFGLNPGGMPLVGDDTTGKVWKFDPALNEDDAGPMSREWTGALDVPSRVRCNNVILDCTVGVAGAVYPDDDPQCQLRTSDDRGKTWSGWRNAPLGRQGQFGHEAQWKGLGAMNRPGRLFHWRVTDDVRVSPRRAKFNERLV